MFLLRPDPIVNLLIMYCLAYSAKKYDIRIHAYGVMSNHYLSLAKTPSVLKSRHLSAWQMTVS